MKCYITFGDQEKIYDAGNQYQACVMMFYSFFKCHEDDGVNWYRYIDTMPVFFRVSQRGFNIHDEDEIVTSALIIKLLLLNNTYRDNQDSA